VNGGRAQERDLFEEPDEREGRPRQTDPSAAGRSLSRSTPPRFDVGHALVDQLASLLDSIPSRPVTPDETPSR
jgi:hypothetical protein